MSLQTIARRYASALAEVAIERHEADEVEQEINAWAKLIDETQLREVFSNPTVPYDQKRRVLEELIARTKVRETTASFLRVLLRNQRIAELKAVAERFAQVLDERRGIVTAKVTTARPIAEDLQATLEQTMSAVSGRTVKLFFTTDETIVGGVVTQIGSTIFDGSIEGQLERLRSDFVNR
ncbi:MAG TPA: ATP synthase F1 subunit delta [Pyrinomonadaceae bacterium]|nr:ATP synthase F1 subunit delta [Pyrinomonadaceae bacterium]